MEAAAVQLPVELRPFKTLVDSYVMAKVKQFAGAFTRRFNMNLNSQQVDLVVGETLATLAQQEHHINNSRVLRLVLRHDCQSTGCGEPGCLLCQYNPSRLCKRNLKNKYLIDDHLRAKCSAPLRVELVDETGACVSEGLPHGTQLEVHVLNGEKYKEICPDNTLLSHLQLHTCVISHHTKALLKRDGGSDDQLRCFLQLERGQGPLSDLQVTTSSEALLAGKAPTFRLLVWAVDALGEPVNNVTYVVSENFVVATKRVKHAIKSDIPSVADSVSKLVHIGKATVDKLVDLRSAAREEGFDISLPDELNRIDKVGQFQQLVEQSEMNSDLKNKIRHLLKLSPEKWEEVSQHALAAVVPDFRNRVWWCPNIRTGLLFACKNGSVAMEHPVALVKMAAVQGEEDQVIPIHQLDPVLFHTIPKLKQQAVQSWYAAAHPGWAIYWKEGQQQDQEMASALQYVSASQAAAAMVPQLPPAPALDLPGGGGRGPSQPSAPRAPAPSPFEMIAKPLPQQQQQQQQGGGGSKGPLPKSPFGSSLLMSNISDAFPSWQGHSQGQVQPQAQPQPQGQNPVQNENSLGMLMNQSMGPGNGNMPNFNSLDMLKSDQLGGVDRLDRLPSFLWGSNLGSSMGPLDPGRSSDLLTMLQMQQQQQQQVMTSGTGSGGSGDGKLDGLAAAAAAAAAASGRMPTNGMPPPESNLGAADSDMPLKQYMGAGTELEQASSIEKAMAETMWRTGNQFVGAGGTPPPLPPQHQQHQQGLPQQQQGPSQQHQAVEWQLDQARGRAAGAAAAPPAGADVAAAGLEELQHTEHAAKRQRVSEDGPGGLNL